MFKFKNKLKNEKDDLIYLTLCTESAEILTNAITDKICSIKEDSPERATLMAIRASIEVDLMHLK